MPERSFQTSVSIYSIERSFEVKQVFRMNAEKLEVVSNLPRRGASFNQTKRRPSSRVHRLRIDFDQALELAWDWIGGQGDAFTLYQELTEEFPWGWIFYGGPPLPEKTLPQRGACSSLKIDR